MSIGTFGCRAMGRAVFAEVAAAAFALVLAILVVSSPQPGSPASFVAIAAITIMLAWITVSDLATWSIPDGPVIAVAILGGAWRLGPAAGLPPFPGIAAPSIAAIAADGIIWGGAFLILRESYFRRHSFDGLGFGDVKLALACAVLLGTIGFAWALLLSSLAGLVAALSMRALGRRIDKIPFGAFLAPACGLIWLAGLGR